MKVHRLERHDTALLVVDVQQRLAAAMDPEALARMLGRLGALIEGARVLGIPIAVTEQYPKGLGHTVRSIKERLGDVPVVEKLRFSALDGTVRERLAGRRHVVVAGMETHVCVWQTVRGLRRNLAAISAETERRFVNCLRGNRVCLQAAREHDDGGGMERELR